MTALAEFHHDVLQDIYRHSDSAGELFEHNFFEYFCDILVDAGELSEYTHVGWAGGRLGSMRVDGYEGDPDDYEGTLTLIVSDFNQADTPTPLHQSDVLTIFKRVHSFTTEAISSSLRDRLDESYPIFSLADLIARRWKKVSKVRFILVTNRELRIRVDSLSAGKINETPVSYSVWDISRLQRYVVSGQGREEIEIDFVKEFGAGIPVLPAHLNDAGYEAYLAVIPGAQLAAIFDRWGNRLLEQNVRVFLQARGETNRGIRNTILLEPDMFFAYNNGIAATADRVVTETTDGGMVITRLVNLQIVNGGQTTSSIHAAMRNKTDLSRVFVQMKLSIIDPARAETVVPYISRYANSQNKVRADDFFANHPFHVRLEEISRRLTAPSTNGGIRESRWFYERTRGQYQSARSGLTDAKLRAFDLEFPRNQMFTKTDLAKWLLTWDGQPEIVSRGAQKNFAAFAPIIGDAWEKDPAQFNEEYFRDSVAKGIIFEATEKLVSAQPWYEGGYRANTVTYAIAKLAYDARTMSGARIDLQRVWRLQGPSEALERALVASAEAVHGVLTDPPAGSRNVTEWAKKPDCWTRVKGLRVQWPEAFKVELVDSVAVRSRHTDSAKVQKLTDGIEAQTIVVNAGSDLWQDVARWGLEQRLVSYREDGILKSAFMIPVKIPSEKQSAAIIKIHRRMLDEGCPYGRDLYTKA